MHKVLYTNFSTKTLSSYLAAVGILLRVMAKGSPEALACTSILSRKLALAIFSSTLLAAAGLPCGKHTAKRLSSTCDMPVWHHAREK